MRTLSSDYTINGNLIKKFRNKMLLSRPEFARKCAISTGCFIIVENGKTPSAITARKILAGLGMTPEEGARQGIVVVRNA
jgi:DNA-binding XRE family transcriptional regulator